MCSLLHGPVRSATDLHWEHPSFKKGHELASNGAMGHFAHVVGNENASSVGWFIMCSLTLVKVD